TNYINQYTNKGTRAENPVIQLNKHDRYVRQLSQRLRGNYDVLYTHYPIFGRKCQLAEIDVVGIKDGVIDVYEIKCSPRITKARRQLQRIKRLLSNVHHVPINTFFYCGMSNAVLAVNC
ncbi:MAG TPA: hypothetical protein VJK52_04600, partial [Candidatus Nanoarchaeia archaeon]|nr:hypothetical protein [Candidatus Nanoarchaeia archaeon]